MNNLLNRFLGWFYSTFLGGMFFNFLLWVDRKRSKKYYLTPKEVTQVIREYSLVNEGVLQIKKEVNKLITSKSAEEYNTILRSVENMISYAEGESDTPKARLADMLRSLYVKKGTKDIITLTDKAKMIDQRINDMKELQEHTIKRKLLTKIRNSYTEGNLELAQLLEQEFKTKYGRHNTRR